MKAEINEGALRHLRKRATILQFQNVPRSRFEGQVIADTLKALGLWETKKSPDNHHEIRARLREN